MRAVQSFRAPGSVLEIAACHLRPKVAEYVVAEHPVPAQITARKRFSQLQLVWRVSLGTTPAPWLRHGFTRHVLASCREQTRLVPYLSKIMHTSMHEIMIMMSFISLKLSLATVCIPILVCRVAARHVVPSFSTGITIM